MKIKKVNSNTKDIKIDQWLNYEKPRYFNVSISDIFPIWDLF